MEKPRFCGMCGSALDKKTGICKVCGNVVVGAGVKKPRGIVITSLVLCVAIILSVVFIVPQFKEKVKKNGVCDIYRIFSFFKDIYIDFSLTRARGFGIIIA